MIGLPVSLVCFVHCKPPTLYLLAKLHKRLYKPRFIANSSSCTSTKAVKKGFLLLKSSTLGYGIL